MTHKGKITLKERITHFFIQFIYTDLAYEEWLIEHNICLKVTTFRGNVYRICPRDSKK